MGFWDTIKSVASSALSAASSICSKIGGALSSVLDTMGNKMGLYIQVAIAAISVICKALGIFKEKEKPEDLGQAAEQSDKKPEDFKSTEEYIEHLRENIRSGKAKIREDLSDEEKLKYSGVAASIGLKATGEKYGVGVGELTDFMYEALNCGLKAKEIAAILELNKKGLLRDVTEYLGGKDITSGTKRSEISSDIKESISKVNPSLSNEDLIKRFNEVLAERDGLRKELEGMKRES